MRNLTILTAALLRMGTMMITLATPALAGWSQPVYSDTSNPFLLLTSWDEDMRRTNFFM